MTVQFHSERRVREIGPQPRTSEPDVPSARSGDRNWRARGSGRPGMHAANRIRRQSPTGGAIKRTLDISMALSALVTLSPLFILTALLIKLTDRGPIFYRHVRLGHGRRSFACVKFRTMVANADEVLAEHLRSSPDAAGEWASSRKLKNDPRVTAVGAVLRKLSIDELPQLINVLRGEMSMIGPRPERPHFVEQLARIIPFYNERSYVKPGITGWAQVNYPYGASVEDARQKLSYDLYYVKNRSLLLDVLILIATIRVILFREGAR